MAQYFAYDCRLPAGVAVHQVAASNAEGLVAVAAGNALHFFLSEVCALCAACVCSWPRCALQ